MPHTGRLDAFDHPFSATVACGEILVTSDQCPIAVVLTPDAAAATAENLLAAAAETKAPRRGRSSESERTSER